MTLLNPNIVDIRSISLYKKTLINYLILVLVNVSSILLFKQDLLILSICFTNLKIRESVSSFIYTLITMLAFKYFYYNHSCESFIFNTFLELVWIIFAKYLYTKTVNFRSQFLSLLTYYFLSLVSSVVWIGYLILLFYVLNIQVLNSLIKHITGFIIVDGVGNLFIRVETSIIINMLVTNVVGFLFIFTLIYLYEKSYLYQILRFRIKNLK